MRRAQPSRAQGAPKTPPNAMAQSEGLTPIAAVHSVDDGNLEMLSGACVQGGVEPRSPSKQSKRLVVANAAAFLVHEEAPVGFVTSAHICDVCKQINLSLDVHYCCLAVHYTC